MANYIRKRPCPRCGAPVAVLLGAAITRCTRYADYTPIAGPCSFGRSATESEMRLAEEHRELEEARL